MVCIGACYKYVDVSLSASVLNFIYLKFYDNIICKNSKEKKFS